jgi:hypothetical protein
MVQIQPAPAASLAFARLSPRQPKIAALVRVCPELWPCGYDARCNVRNCRAKATVLARSLDSGNRPIKQYELCSVHAEQVTQREKVNGREIVGCGVER